MMLKTLDEVIARIAWTLAAIAGSGLIAIALIVMADVAMRSAGNPLTGASEIVQIVFVVSVFFAFANLIVSERDIRVDAVVSLVPAPGKRVLDVAASTITIALFTLLLFFSAQRVYEAWAHGVFMEGRLLLPKWIPWATIAFGSAMALIGAVLVAFRHALAPRVSDTDREEPLTSVS